MATKREELAMIARGEGCLGKAADDEPVFILRGQDQSAALLVTPDVLEEVKATLQNCVGALESSYNVQEYPGDGSSSQDYAAASARALLEKLEGR